MKANLLFFLLSFIFLGCKLDKQSAPILEAKAIIYNNNLPVDGCAEHIYIEESDGNDGHSVLPDSLSRSLFYDILNKEIAQLPEDVYHGNLYIPVVIKYQKTSDNAELLCGWGKKTIVPQIKIVSIVKR